jgi:hypothetical protein
MASEVPYEVICAITGVQLTEWSQMSVHHAYSATQKKSRPYFLHLDKTQPEVAEELRKIAEAQSRLWEMHDASPTSYKNKENAEKQLAMANASASYDNSEILDELDAIENDSDYDGNVVE